MYALSLMLLASFLLSACTSTSKPFDQEKYRYLTSTPSVVPYGSNYQITHLIQLGDQRLEVKTVATFCQDGIGAIEVVRGSGKKEFESLMLNGPSGMDQIFTRLCNDGLPIALSYDSQLTPEQKRTRDAQSLQVQQILSAPNLQPRSPQYVPVPPAYTPSITNQDPVRCTTTSTGPGTSATRCR